MNIVSTLLIGVSLHSTPWGVTAPVWTQITIHTREAVQPQDQMAAEVERLWCYPGGQCEEYLGQPCSEDVCDGVVTVYILAPNHFVAPLADGILYIEGILPDYTTFQCEWSDPADWNISGDVTSQDFFDFLTCFFVGEADFNLDGVTDMVDLFEYLDYFL